MLWPVRCAPFLGSASGGRTRRRWPPRPALLLEFPRSEPAPFPPIPGDKRGSGCHIPPGSSPHATVRIPCSDLCSGRSTPGLKLHDDRVIRLLETLLHPGAFATDWTTRDVHARVMARHRLAETDYRLSQLRYDLTKLRAKGFVERLGTSRRYRLTPLGLKLGVLLVKLRTRLLGPLVTLLTNPNPPRPSSSDNAVQAAFRHVDAALDNLCAALGLKQAA